MAVDTSSMFAQVIQDHLELKRRNAALEHEMPLEQVHERRSVREPSALQDRGAGAVRGHDGRRPVIEDEATSLDWPTTEDTFIDAPAAAPPRPTRRRKRTRQSDADERSDESLWSRSRDFDWGD